MSFVGHLLRKRYPGRKCHLSATPDQGSCGQPSVFRLCNRKWRNALHVPGRESGNINLKSASSNTPIGARSRVAESPQAPPPPWISLRAVSQPPHLDDRGMEPSERWQSIAPASDEPGQRRPAPDRRKRRQAVAVACVQCRNGKAKVRRTALPLACKIPRTCKYFRIAARHHVMLRANAKCWGTFWTTCISSTSLSCSCMGTHCM